jgi:predicted DNA-binding ribbon-helix-helix protein
MIFRSDLPHSSVIKHSIEIAGRETSISLEDPFWQQLKNIAVSRGMTVSDLVAKIDRERTRPNLSSQLRLFVLAEAGSK